MKRFFILYIVIFLINTLNSNIQAQVDPNHVGNYIWQVGDNYHGIFCSFMLRDEAELFYEAYDWNE